MQLKIRDGRWQVVFRDSAGKRRRLSLHLDESVSKKDAERAASHRIQRFLTTGATEEERRPTRALVNLAEALEHTYLVRWKNTRSDIQLKYVVRRMEREIGHWLLDEIDYKRLRAYRDDTLKTGVTPATVNRRLSILSVAIREAHREGAIVAMPAWPEKLAEKNIRQRYMTTAEEQCAREFLGKRVAVEQIEGGNEWAYMTALFDFLLDTGCRLGEALHHLKPEHYDGRAVRFPPGVTKNDEPRVIPLTPRAKLATDALLAHPLHGSLTLDWAGHRWGVARDACGFPDLNLHILRHTCASRLLKRGISLHTVSKWLGHSSLRTTMRYAHLEEGTLEQAAAALAQGPVALPATPRDTEQFQRRHHGTGNDTLKLAK